MAWSCRATGGPMLVREVKAELVPVFLDGLQRSDLGIGMPGEAARIKAPCVIAGLAMDDLLCQKPAMAATLADPGAKPDDAIGVALAGIGPTSGCRPWCR